MLHALALARCRWSPPQAALQPVPETTAALQLHYRNNIHYRHTADTLQHGACTTARHLPTAWAESVECLERSLDRTRISRGLYMGLERGLERWRLSRLLKGVLIGGLDIWYLFSLERGCLDRSLDRSYLSRALERGLERGLERWRLSRLLKGVLIAPTLERGSRSCSVLCICMHMRIHMYIDIARAYEVEAIPCN